jgi:6,7-dimethyl-8-ribityllumazine synthase
MQNAVVLKTKPFNAQNWRIGIVKAQFNSDITNAQHISAIKRAKQYKLKDENITTLNVAGSMEIPLALQTLAKTGKYKALIALGCVIKGETPHFDYVCRLMTDGILKVQLKYDIPIGFGVLTCNNLSEAQARTKLAGDHLDAAMQLAREISEVNIKPDRLT